jgi:transcriptional regulator with XRE-family HTH domain
MGQKEMAELVKCATITIQKIENRGLTLSEGLARRISHETGVPLQWLLKGDPLQPALGLDGSPYSRESYDRFRARKTPRNKFIDELMLPIYSLICHAEIRAIAESAHNRGADFQLFRYKLDLVLSELAREFGACKSIGSAAPSDVALRALNEAEANGRTLIELSKSVLANLTMPPTSKRSSSRRPRKV